MNIFGKKTREDEKEFERLIVALKRVEKPVLSIAQISSLKERVLRNVVLQKSVDFVPAQMRSLREKIKAIGRGVVLPAAMVCRLKERIMGVVENTPMFVPAGPYSRYFRAVVSGVLLVVFTVTALISAPFKVPVTYAASFLDEVSGDVVVLRDGRMMVARQDLSILEGDVILTRAESSVTVHFLDESVSRLGENTGLEINKLYTDPRNPVITRVELFLKSGRLWTKVFNLIGENSEFEVKTQKAVAAVPKKAAFDMQADGDFTRVAVYDNMVDLVSADAADNAPARTVIAGYRAEIGGSSAGLIEVKQMVVDDPETKLSTKWLAGNMAKDEDYGQRLVDTTIASVTSDVPAEVVVDGSVGAAVVFSSEFEDGKNYFISHYNDLVKAETMFVRGNRSEGSRLLRGFRRGVNNLVTKFPQLELTDPIGAGLLKNFVKEKIAVQLKDFSGFLPGDELFPVKEALLDIELLLADSEVERTKLRVSQAEGVLLDIQELLKENKVSYAAALLNDYRERTAQIILKLDSENVIEFNGKLHELVVQQVRQVKVLTAIEEMLVGEDMAEFRGKVSEQRRGSLLKVLDTLNQMQETVAPELLIELKDVYDTYLADETDRDIVEPVFAKLLGQDGVADGGLNFIQPDGTTIPAEVGVVMIVNMEATPEAGSVSEVASPGFPVSSLEGLDLVPVIVVSSNPAGSQESQD